MDEKVAQDIRDAIKLINWKIDGCDQHGVYPGTHMYLSWAMVCEIYNINYND